MPARLSAFLLLVLFGTVPRVHADVSLTDQQTFVKRARAANNAATAAPLTPTVSPRLVDGTGLEWFINDEVTYSTISSAVGAASDAVFIGAVEATTTGGGTELSVLADAFDGYNALDISVDGAAAVRYNNVGAPSASCGGRQIVMPSLTVGGLQVTRKVYVPAADGFARWLNIVENHSGATRTVVLGISNDLGSDAATLIGTTSSGDAVATTADSWITTYEAFTQGSSRTPRLAHVLSSPGAAVQPSQVLFANGNDKPTWGYSFSVPSGSKIVIANFAAGLGSLSGAALKAASLAALPPSATACMDASEIAGLGNVAPGPVPSGPEPTGPADLNILSPTAEPTFVATTPFLSIGGTAGATRLQNVTWSSSNGAAGTALGLTDWTIPDVGLSPGTNTITVVAHYADGLPPITDTLTVVRGALSYELPEGATGPFFTTDLLIANPNDTKVDAEVEFLKADGTKLTMPIQELAAKSRTTISLNTVPGLEDTTASSIVRSAAGAPLVVERSMFWNNTSYGSHGAAAIDGPRNRFLFSEGSQGFFRTYVLLANANSSNAAVTLRFLPETGNVVTREVIVGPTSRLTFDVGDVPELLTRSFAITVDADKPIVAERAMYFGGPQLFAGGTDSAGVGQAATEWYFAEGASGFFDTFYLLGNAGSRTATATLSFQKIGGGVVTVTKDVLPYSRLTVNPMSESPELGAGVSYSLAVTATEPVIAERSMYWGNADAGAWYEGHNSFGVNEPAMKWGLAEGRVGMDRQFHTYILIGNSGNVDSQVRVTYLLTGGGSIDKTYLVPQKSRFNVDVNTMVPELAGQEFGAIVEVLTGSPVIVERSLYSASGGVPLAAGTNTAAVRLP